MEFTFQAVTVHFSRIKSSLLKNYQHQPQSFSLRLLVWYFQPFFPPDPFYSLMVHFPVLLFE